MIHALISQSLCSNFIASLYPCLGEGIRHIFHLRQVIRYVILVACQESHWHHLSKLAIFQTSTCTKRPTKCRWAHCKSETGLFQFQAWWCTCSLNLRTMMPLNNGFQNGHMPKMGIWYNMVLQISLQSPVKVDYINPNEYSCLSHTTIDSFQFLVLSFSFFLFFLARATTQGLNAPALWPALISCRH